MPLVQERAGTLFKRVTLDLSGPCRLREEEKCIYLLLKTVSLSGLKWSPFRTKLRGVVAAAFADTWVTQYGSPRLLHQDNGSEFTAEVFVELCKLLGITRTTTTPYYP
jgi:transposase InsO family protein